MQMQGAFDLQMRLRREDAGTLAETTTERHLYLLWLETRQGLWEMNLLFRESCNDSHIVFSV